MSGKVGKLASLIDRIAPPMPEKPEPVEAYPDAKPQSRMYAAAKYSRLNADWVTFDTSADTELHTSLAKLRSLCRALCRDNALAKRARQIVTNNVIGGGIGLQAQVYNARGRLLDSVNSAIEEAWDEWSDAESCHVGGKLCFSDLERLAMAEIFEAGEVLIRKHPLAMGRDNTIPFALELIEAERLADDYMVEAVSTGNFVIGGVEVDRLHRPIAYWIRSSHPNEYRQDLRQQFTLERVPADQIFHLYVVNRWPQTRGEPWMHAVIRRLQDINGYSEAEIVKARAAACIMAFITSPELPTPDGQDAGKRQYLRDLEAGIIEYLNPGEEATAFNPQNQTAMLDAFLRMLVREVAAGCGVSYESLSRDYSQSNYSSSRLSLIEDRDNWRVLQRWFIENFREPLHRDWLGAAMMSGSIDGINMAQYAAQPKKYREASFKPRGWSWIDPTKEVQAYRDAVQAGFMTVSDVISLTGSGQDIEDVLHGRRRELDMMAELGLQPDTNAPKPAVPAAPSLSTDPGETGDTHPGD